MSKIRLQGNASGTGTLTIASPNTNSDTTVNLPSTLGNAGSSAMLTTDASGNAGLGVTPSAWSSYRALQLAGGGSLVSFGNAAEVWSNAFFNGSSNLYIANGFATRYHANNNGAHAWYTAPSGTAGNTVSFTQAMTLAADGNLLVGTTTSSGTSGRLHVAGTAVGGEVSARIENLDSTNAVSETGLRFMFNGALKGYLGTIYGSGGASTMYFYNNGAERARITSGGTFLIRQTSAIGGALEVGGFNSNSFISSTGIGVSGNSHFQNSLRVDGTPFAFQSSWTVISDSRTKNVNGAFAGGLTEICALEPVRFTYNGRAGTAADGVERIGLVADSVQQVMPYCVGSRKAKLNDGDDEDTTILSLDTSPMLFAMINAIKEQQAIIEQLKADVAALKGA